MTKKPEDCTTADVTFRHCAGTLTIPATNDFLGALGKCGTTACGEADAMGQLELDMWYAEWGVPKDRRATIADLPPCPTCFAEGATS